MRLPFTFAILLAATLLQAAPPAAVVHGGADSPRSRMDGTDRAAAKALEALKGGGSALDAALAGVVVLEDDPRFNAGTGAKGNFAAAISTGGTTITFYGRVGDVPIYGAGIYAGPKGAVACTGNGEDIIKHRVAKAADDRLARGMTDQKAVNQALAAFPADIDLGLVAIGPASTGGGCHYSAEQKPFTKDYRNQMAWSLGK